MASGLVTSSVHLVEFSRKREPAAAAFDLSGNLALTGTQMSVTRKRIQGTGGFAFGASSRITDSRR